MKKEKEEVVEVEKKIEEIAPLVPSLANDSLIGIVAKVNEIIRFINK